MYMYYFIFFFPTFLTLKAAVTHLSQPRFGTTSH